jgi:hypothetical protein
MNKNNISKTINKEGQISIYLIVGLLFILILVGIFIFIRLDMFSTKIQLDTMDSINEHINYCVKKFTIPAINLLASNGGYIYDYNSVLKTEHIQIAYHVINWSDESITREFMESELSQVVEDTILDCLYNLKKDIPFQFNISEPKANVVIAKKEIIVSLDMDVKFVKDDIEKLDGRHQVIIESELNNLIDIKDKIILEIISNKEVNINKLMKHDAEITVLPYDNNNIILSITRMQKPNEFLMFNFVVMTDDISIEKPIVGFIPNMVAYVDEEFYYELPIYSDIELEYNSDTVLFNINDGKIRFTPLYINQGKHDIKINIKSQYYTIQRDFTLSIEKR